MYSSAAVIKVLFIVFRSVQPLVAHNYRSTIRGWSVSQYYVIPGCQSWIQVKGVA